MFVKLIKEEVKSISVRNCNDLIKDLPWGDFYLNIDEIKYIDGCFVLLDSKIIHLTDNAVNRVVNILNQEGLVL